MVAEKSTDKLPPGWKEYVKVKNGRKVKYYSKAANGQKFYSKMAVMRYENLKSDGNDTQPQSETDCSVPPLPQSKHRKRGSNSKANSGAEETNKLIDTLHPQNETDCNDTPQPQCKHRKRDSKSKANSGAEETNKSPAWLPSGWIMEEKSRKGVGATYKIYIDPATGSKFYSKPQVSQYLETLAKKEGAVQNNTNTTGCQTSLGDDVHKYHRLGMSQGCVSKKETSSYNKHSMAIVCSNVVESDFVDGLPVGWTKEIKTRTYAKGRKKDVFYTDPVSGYVFYSKKDALRYVETGDINKCVIRPKKRDETDTIAEVSSPTERYKTFQKKDVSEHCLSRKGWDRSEKAYDSIIKHPVEDQVENASVVGLPPGWIKELMARGDAHGRMDAIYTDPISGYMFRSKKDALRYIETGDISKCAIKPKKRDADDSASTKLISCPYTPCDVNYSLRSSSRKVSVVQKLNGGKEYGDASISMVSEAEFSKRKHGDGLTVDAAGTESLTEEPSKKHLHIRGRKSRKTSHIYRNACDAWTDRTDKKGFAKDRVEQETCRNTPADSRSSNKGMALSVSCRTSKRIAGLQPEMPANLQLSERSLRAAIRKSTGDEADILAMITMNPVANVPAQPLLSEPLVNAVPSYEQLSEDRNKQRSCSTVTESKRPRNQMTKDVPGRTSKRLAGCQPEMPPNLELSERSLRAAIRNSCEDEANILQMITMNTVPSELPQPLHSVPDVLPQPLHSVPQVLPQPLHPVPSPPPRPLYSKLASVGADPSLHQEVPKDIIKQRVGRKAPEGVIKSNKRIASSTPGRTSQRLAGRQPETPSNLQSRELSLRAAMKKPCEDEAHMLPMFAMSSVPIAQSQPLNCEPSSGTAIGRSREGESFVIPISNTTNVAERLPQPLSTELAPAVGDIVSMVVESISKMDDGEQNEELSAEGRVVSEKKTGEQINGKQEYENFRSLNSQGGYSFMDPWSDPCLDFAFKTLTGDLPDDDTLAYQSNCQTNIPPAQRDGYFGQSGSDNFGYSQGGMPSHSNPVKQYVGAEHLPGNLTSISPPPGFSVPYFGGIGSQQPSSQARNKNYKRSKGSGK